MINGTAYFIDFTFFPHNVKLMTSIYAESERESC